MTGEGPMIDALFAQEGTRREAAGNSPFLLDDPGRVWEVAGGGVDVFAVEVAESEVRGARRYMFSVPEGGVLFGITPDAGFALLAVGAVGVHLLELPLDRLQDRGATELAPVVESFAEALGAAVAHYQRPRLHHLCRVGETTEVGAGERVGAAETVWVRAEEGVPLFAGLESLALPQGVYFPLTEGLWLEGEGPLQLAGVGATAALQHDAWAGLRALLELFVGWAADCMGRDARVEQERLRHKADADARVASGALAGLARLMEPDGAAAAAADAADPLLAACRLVGRTQGIEFLAPPARQRRAKDPLREIALVSKVRFRRVALRGAWWEQDNGPLLCSVTETHAWAVALPLPSGHYELVDPTDGSRRRIDAVLAGTLDPFGVMFYRSFPPGPLSLSDVFEFGLRDLKRDMGLVVLLGVAGGLLGMATPLVTGMLFSTVIPTADRGQLLELSLALVVAALAMAMFNLTRGFALLRIAGKSTAIMQAAVWDRLLGLPLPFFRDYSVGDLSNRANAVNALQTALNGSAVTAIMGALTSVFNLFLLFYYSATLAVVAVGLLLVSTAITGLLTWLSLSSTREVQDIDGKIASLMFQMIGGIAKLRVAAAERRAFAVWAGLFRRKKQLGFEAGTLQNYAEVFNGILPLCASMAIFATVAFAAPGQISTGSFIAFSAAFGAFLSAGIALSTTALELLQLVPVFEGAQPIFAAVPEADASKPDPGELFGRIEASHLSFRYREDGPLILDDVSFTAEPGEFVGFVGPSGSGKSTTLRLLLGFEAAESGAIYLDGQELDSVDITAVRRQMGVVLQSGRLTTGSVFSNIVGASALTRDDAWEAARMAGLDADIEQMPMGMDTVISEGGSTLSGGQRQRLLIARALVNKPRLLLFDEATSALDNRTQRIVSESLERLNATRIVIAHRLSTIQNADRIFVFERGRVVQSGTFETLQQEEGLFKRLVSRQLE